MAKTTKIPWWKQSQNINAAGVGLRSGGSLSEGIVSYEMSKASSDMREANASSLEQAAAAIGFKAKFDQKRLAIENRRIVGRLRASAAAAGARLDTGAPVQAVIKQEAEHELAQMMIGHNARQERANLKYQAQLQRYQGSLDRIQGRTALFSGGAKAVGGLVSGLLTGKT